MPRAIFSDEEGGSLRSVSSYKKQNKKQNSEVVLLGAHLPPVTWQEKRNLSRYLGGSQGAGRRGSSLIQLQVIVPQRRFLAVKIL